jgi:hypothetical protein
VYREKTYDILKVDNSLVKSVYYVKECTTCNLVNPSQKDIDKNQLAIQALAGVIIGNLTRVPTALTFTLLRKASQTQSDALIYTDLQYP